MGSRESVDKELSVPGVEEGGPCLDLLCFSSQKPSKDLSGAQTRMRSVYVLVEIQPLLPYAHPISPTFPKLFETVMTRFRTALNSGNSDDSLQRQTRCAVIDRKRTGLSYCGENGSYFSHYSGLATYTHAF